MCVITLPLKYRLEDLDISGHKVAMREDQLIANQCLDNFEACIETGKYGFLRQNSTPIIREMK